MRRVVMEVCVMLCSDGVKITPEYEFYSGLSNRFKRQFLVVDVSKRTIQLQEIEDVI